MSQTPKHDADDAERESDKLTMDGEAIQNSTPEGLEEERQRNSKREANNGRT